MYLSRVCVGILVIASAKGLFLHPSSETGGNAVRKASRWNLPWMGIGMWCNGCPATGCEDDEAIIHGYCCGCAYSLDRLPVLCPQFLQCPLNLHGLCHDYEYMMRCCC
ncbi:uncharacterized protein LOC128676970 [Plodia interpunctella]|uniref:uncharacterized protein LOC128676970 n=1 Tax=Plodia interpunctella TaxID=58824 RepID=UPI0023685A58|nr:uncharacterized protein LOC128676970 [Plodia interpunctella]